LTETLPQVGLIAELEKAADAFVREDAVK